MLLVFRDCRGLVSDLMSLQHSETNPSDAATEPHDVTHAPDALRYYCRTRCLPGIRPDERYYDDESRKGAIDYEDAMTGGEVGRGYLGY
jgi:hypothetical protein